VAELHIITSEYPPQAGGVSDYTHVVANGLAAAGDEVHVWSPLVESKAQNGAPESAQVFVHRDLGRLSPWDLRHAGELLDRFSAPRRLLVQWVPHSYGYRSMNLPFCLWLWNRARRKGDLVEVMAHECFLPFKRWAWKQNFAALVQRLMTMILLRAARRVWISIPAWETRWRPFALGRQVPFVWLPVPSNIEVVHDPMGVSAVRERYGVNGDPVLGHFGTYARHDRRVLEATLPQLFGNGEETKLILMGRDSDSMRDQLIKRHPDLRGVIHATGTLDARDLSLHLSACDVLLQPCRGGVSTRRTSIMAGLSHGRPIVTTSGWQTDALWRESQAVALVPDGDVKAIAEETRRLLSDKKERERLSRYARVFYEERFDWRHTISALRR